LTKNSKSLLAEEIIEKAIAYGSNLAGLADVAALKKSPSHVLYEQLPYRKSSSLSKESEPSTQGKVVWPEDAKTMAVIAIAHPEDEPHLDWWYKKGQPGGTQGNLLLIRVFNKLSKWLEDEKGIKTIKISYFIEEGGIFLKDAAALAGIGVVGKNNMLVTEKYGPRVRLRALGLPLELGSTGLLDFDPCKGCSMPCRSVCPQACFAEKVYSAETCGLTDLPAREGVYDRKKCYPEMGKNITDSEKTSAELGGKKKETAGTSSCRRCEFSCIAGIGK